jgi:hypothetical protein
MNVYDNLIIRQCKKRKTSINALKKIAGVRCAIPKVSTNDLARIMIDLVDEYAPMTMNQFISDLDRHSGFFDFKPINNREEFHTRIINVCIVRLSLTIVQNNPKMEGYRVPRAFRD